MVYVGMIYNPKPRSADEEALSKAVRRGVTLAGLYDLDELGPADASAGRPGRHECGRPVDALSDAGNGLEAFIDLELPGGGKDSGTWAWGDAPGGVRQAIPASDTSERLLAAWCHTLKHAGRGDG